MNNTSLRLDEGAVMSSFRHTSDATGSRIEFRYLDLTADLNGAPCAVSNPVVSHLLTTTENTKMLESILAVEVPGTKLAQDADEIWRLRKLMS